MRDSRGPWWSTWRKRTEMSWKGYNRPNDARRTETSTDSETNTGINVTPQEQKQTCALRTTSTYLTQFLHSPFFPSVTDAFSNYFFDFWITDFTVACRFHSLQNQPVSNTYACSKNKQIETTYLTTQEKTRNDQFNLKALNSFLLVLAYEAFLFFLSVC